jgi:thiol-disulfide isomerase/thioredoxin
MAQRTPKVLSDLRKLVGTAAYGPDETIEVNGKTVACKIIKTEGELPQSSAHITARFTFWVDQKTHLIRKMTELRKGPLNPTDPDMNYVMERLTLFTIADLNAVPQADETFKFTPPMTASLVEQIEDPISAAIGQLVGKQAPEIGLKATDGKDIFLKSFQGKPVLLDFWATWCPPCVESLPALEKLYREIAKSGLIFLSLDQDEQSRTAEEFWSRHNEPWPNFHASADTLGHFPKHGIPYFVLIDASGQIVFSAAGFDETALRAAFAKLGPAFTATP